MEDVRKAVRKTYGEIAASGPARSGCCAPSCGSPSAATPSAEDTSKKMGYTDAEVTGAPDGANLGLGCGNPQAIAALRVGETVLDLGSGGGFDCFLAARQVGESGAVIGVDMTPEMVTLARENAAKAGTRNVEFRLGEIEHLPAADGSVDVIISNCVINLSPEKPEVFREGFRVLRHGGRLAISDVVATAPLPAEVRQDLDLHVGCMAGAATIDDIEAMLRDVGFVDVRIRPVDESRELIREWSPGHGLEDYVLSASIEARKP